MPFLFSFPSFQSIFPKALSFFLLLLAGSMMASGAFAQPQPENDPDAAELGNLRLELQALRGEVNRLHEQTRAHVDGQSDILNDRIAALEQRVVGVEERLNSIFLEISGIEEVAMLLLLFLFGVCVLTLLSVFVMRRKLIDPVHLQVSRLRAELKNAGDDRARTLTAVFDDMAEDDPYVAQLLKKHGLK